ncbi:Phosphotransferase family protein [Mycena sanguinolenta]|uniref:Phosphotransferase family protein n=1 Tax=Mycena sanguinolenta TaxID=230812 RepID=A0A8H7DFL8_9AGAR|nr:Phosphotransferase family protein [Mycena sanguinolenta]
MCNPSLPAFHLIPAGHFPHFAQFLSESVRISVDRDLCVFSGSFLQTLMSRISSFDGAIIAPCAPAVTSVSFSPDGKWIVSASLKTVRVWDSETGELVAGPFDGHTDWVTSVAFSPDGKRIVSASHDKAVRVWYPEIGDVVARPFEGHTDWVTSVAFSPDGMWIVSGSHDKTVRVWDSERGTVVAGPFGGHTNWVTSVAFSPDGKRIVSGSLHKTVRVWYSKSGETGAGPFNGHTDWVTSVAFSPDGKRIVSGSYDKTVRVWHSESGEVVDGPFDGHTDWVTSVAFSPDGRRIVSASLDKTVRVRVLENGEEISGPFDGHTSLVSSIAFSPDGKRIVSGSNDETLRVWDSESGEVVCHVSTKSTATMFNNGITVSSGLFVHERFSTGDPSLTETLAQTQTKMQHSDTRAKLNRILASFDLSALKAQATKIMGKTCLGVHLLSFGGYNIVFILPFNDATDVLARLRIPGNGFDDGDSSISGDDLATRFASEVATLRFIKSKTSIPVPQLYHWDSDPTNPIGTRYMLMQRIPAPVLAHVMKDISYAGWRKIVIQIAHYETQLLGNPLSSIGALFDEHGTVGRLIPTCTAPFLLRQDRGPFRCSKDFLLASVDSQLDLIINHRVQWTAWRAHWSELNGGVESIPAEYAVRWFELLRDAICNMPDELHLQFPQLPATVFRLAHTDFNEGNLLISSAEDATIVAVLDWEGAQVLPSWDAWQGCGVSWIPWTKLREDDAAELRKLYFQITTENDRWLGMSLLQLQGLLALLDSPQAIISNRTDFDAMYLSWFHHAQQTGGQWCSDVLKGFQRLKEFIEVGISTFEAADLKVYK